MSDNIEKTKDEKADEKDPTYWLEKHGDYLFRYAMTRVRDKDLAEDLVQETLLAGMGSVDRFSGKSTIRTWLASILKHKVIDHFRKSGRQASLKDADDLEYLMDSTFKDDGHWKTGPAKWEADPSEVLERGEFWEAYEGCLKNLPENHARAFTMREIDGMDGKEISKVLGISSSNLWVMLHRGRLALKNCLEQTFFAEGNNI